jgi:hypothetical protein
MPKLFRLGSPVENVILETGMGRNLLTWARLACEDANVCSILDLILDVALKFIRPLL